MRVVRHTLRNEKAAERENLLGEKVLVSCIPLLPALRENSLLMTGAPVLVVNSFVLKFTFGMQGVFLSLQPPCRTRRQIASNSKQHDAMAIMMP